MVSAHDGDLVMGGQGHDLIRVEPADGTGFGEGTYYGGQGHDTIEGSDGGAYFGEEGRDLLSAGRAAELTGGAGADRFVIQAQAVSNAEPGQDTRVMDYDPQEDALVLLFEHESDVAAADFVFSVAEGWQGAELINRADPFAQSHVILEEPPGYKFVEDQFETGTLRAVAETDLAVFEKSFEKAKFQGAKQGLWGGQQEAQWQSARAELMAEKSFVYMEAGDIMLRTTAMQAALMA